MNNPEFFQPRFNKDISSLDRLSIEEMRDFNERYVHAAVDKNKIDEDEFDEVYDRDEIDHDKASVIARQEIFQTAQAGVEQTAEQRETVEKLAILAKLFEAICSDHTVLSRVYGLSKGEIVAQSTSDLDDISRQTDLLLEFPREKLVTPRPENYTMGLDVTISKRSFKKKFDEFYSRSSENPDLTKIKYFRESGQHVPSDRRPIMGETKLPRYIINAKPEELVDLIEGWKIWQDNFRPMSDPKETKALFKESGLGKSKMWYRILYQLKLEAYTFHKMYKDSRPDLSNVYAENYKVFSKHCMKLKQSYIQGNSEWHERYVSLSREKDELTKSARYELLQRQVHDEYNGDDMSYIKAIIQGK